jgi:hypothetical protein
MKHEVHVTLTLKLWLDASWDDETIVTHVRTQLPLAFGDELTTLQNPIDVLSIEQETHIYGTEEP